MQKHKTPAGKLRHVFIMDPPARMKIWKDTTYHLMRACIERGHRVFYCDPQTLTWHNQKLTARAQSLDINAEDAAPYKLFSAEEIDLGAVDVIWIRTDPPFDRRYFYATLLLERLPATVRILNRPGGLRDCNEKIAALAFPKYTPPTLLTADANRIAAFAEEHGRVVLKPVDGFGGRGIRFYRAGEAVEILRAATNNGRHWIVAQAYVAAARAGDKRVLLLQGEILGGILRVHADGAELNNLDAGGRAQPLQLSPRDMEICSAVKPMLAAHGVFFAGLDIIGDYLIEINITSPTGLQELCRFNGQNYHHQIIAALE